MDVDKDMDKNVDKDGGDGDGYCEEERVRRRETTT